MTDAEALERFNVMLEAQAELAASVDRTLTEVPPGRPQIAYYERGGGAREVVGVIGRFVPRITLRAGLCGDYARIFAG